MWLYLILFAIPLIAFKTSGDGRSKVFLIGYLALIALFVGMSDMFGGYDRYIYGEAFDSIATSPPVGKPMVTERVQLFPR